MAVSFGFYDSLNGDRKYTAVQFSYLFNSLIKDGIFMHVGEHLNVKEGTGMQVNVGSGFAWFNSTWTRNDADYSLTITASDLLQVRIDAIVLEVDETVSSRTNSIKVITGTPSSNPQKPTLTNTADIHQYPLAYVTVGVGVTSITQANIENCIGTNPCPFVTGVLDTIDATTLIAQWEAQFNEWFENLDYVLEGDVGAKLFSLIDKNKQNIEKVRQEGSFHYKGYFTAAGWTGSPLAQEMFLYSVDGGPIIGPSSVFDSGPMTDNITNNQNSSEIVQESLNFVNAGWRQIIGMNRIKCFCYEKPTTDMWLHFMIRTAFTDFMKVASERGWVMKIGEGNTFSSQRVWRKNTDKLVVMFPYKYSTNYVGWAIMGRTAEDTAGVYEGDNVASYVHDYPVTVNARSVSVKAITSGMYRNGNFMMFRREDETDESEMKSGLWFSMFSENPDSFYLIGDDESGFTNSENPVLIAAEKMLYDAEHYGLPDLLKEV